MDDDTTASTLTIDFCGERHACTPGRTFSVGRDADLSIDDNRYLHRRLLEFEWASGMWWMTNCGQSITVGVATADGTYQAMLGPAGRMPLVSSPLSVVFSAGPFTYELGVILDGSSANPAPDAALPVSTGADTALSATLGATTFTPSQRLLIIALCEPMLRDGMAGASRIPSSAEAAERLGWPITTFNRKLDNVCDKLDRDGVPGLRGGVGKLARNRKSRLVEHAIMARLVTPTDLALLDAGQPREIAPQTASGGSTR
ncbi:MAG: hypothetical protein DSY74_04560 [Actinobacteria bacterium]|jgi:hypothetical protein|nr:MULTISPECIES: hypothetical protein [unclassified Microbacterium]MBU20342.1 hypothetical protein [Microbacterium sp.]MEC8762473.1 hypothetical protein [Actinomycetota bacterium]RUA26687.1 MAG: hypothetical protein DSY74_04560 [Actinomycetota bacterium]HIE62011.1 hypothetical protein [Microbacterium sp.]|tara:strand:+ start:966 stop:1739 length:774 start_codon:yes stop_codon:yes gene_type:complete